MISNNFKSLAIKQIFLYLIRNIRNILFIRLGK